MDVFLGILDILCIISEMIPISWMVFSDFSTNHFKKLKIYIILRRSILSTLNALSTTTKVHLKAKGIYFQPNMQKKKDFQSENGMYYVWQKDESLKEK